MFTVRPNRGRLIAAVAASSASGARRFTAADVVSPCSAGTCTWRSTRRLHTRCARNRRQWPRRACAQVPRDRRRAQRRLAGRVLPPDSGKGTPLWPLCWVRVRTRCHCRHCSKTDTRRHTSSDGKSSGSGSRRTSAEPVSLTWSSPCTRGLSKETDRQ